MAIWLCDSLWKSYGSDDLPVDQRKGLVLQQWQQEICLLQDLLLQPPPRDTPAGVQVQVCDVPCQEEGSNDCALFVVT